MRYYRIRDNKGDVHLAAETEEAWRALVEQVGDPALRIDPRYETMAARKVNEAALDELVGGWCSDRDAVEAESTLGALGVTAARVVPLYELYSRPDPNLTDRGFITRVDHPEAGATWLPGRPWRFSAAPSSPVRPAPCVGQHSREVLREEAGITDSEYDELVAAGVTGALDDTA